MKIYLVGGAVRDEILHLPLKERDWVVVGATEKEMLAKGYLKVGKDFPVFLHPQTKEEYALARKERKVGGGYHGFTFEVDKEVTLEEDLMRRDLTINAMAKSEAGHIIDPFNGQSDCQNRILRHVSKAFVEDPVRVLRLARFAARFHALGFHVADETYALMKEIAKSGELDHLVAERVTKEMLRALQEPSPEVFFEVLQKAEALPKLFAPLVPHFATSQTRLKAIAKESTSSLLRFAAAFSPLSKEDLTLLLNRYRLPNEYRELSLFVVQYYDDFKAARDGQPECMLTLLEKVDAFRKPQRFENFLQVSEVIFHLETKEKSPRGLLEKALQACKMVDIASLLKEGKQGLALKEAIHAGRLRAINSILNKPHA